MRNWIFGKRLGKCTRWEQLLRIYLSFKFICSNAQYCLKWIYQGRCHQCSVPESPHNAPGWLPILKIGRDTPPQLIPAQIPCPLCNPTGEMTVKSLLVNR